MLFCYLFAIFDIQSLVGLVVKHTTLKVEVAAGAVSLDGLYSGLNVGGSSRRCWNVSIVENVKCVWHTAITYVGYASVTEQGAVGVRIPVGLSSVIVSSCSLSKIGPVVSAEGVELGIGVIIRCEKHRRTGCSSHDHRRPAHRHCQPHRQ